MLWDSNCSILYLLEIRIRVICRFLQSAFGIEVNCPFATSLFLQDIPIIAEPVLRGIINILIRQRLSYRERKSYIAGLIVVGGVATETLKPIDKRGTVKCIKL
ncbi:hypothetical protein N7523_008249 [Penicillium sp. IBT 18751x]|nr:hypothetical protein N7523_008249 [Penicillium sp. IBT 18751x]